MGRCDVAIVGGGPAGLAAALVLVRCCRRVTLIDDGRPRNARAGAVHNFLTRDGIPPAELLRLGREEIARLGVEIVDQRVERAACQVEPGWTSGFRLILSDHRELLCRKLLLATGVVDVLPDAAGFAEFYGRGVYHCPYCDAWELRGRRLAAVGRGDAAAGLALALLTWSPAVAACVEGEAPGPHMQQRLAALGVQVVTAPIKRIEGGPEGGLQRLQFVDGSCIPCDALFFNTGQVQRSSLPAMLGCSYKPRDQISTTERQGTGVRGLFLAGDADGDVQFAVVAAAEGATAAAAINRELQDEDCG